MKLKRLLREARRVLKKKLSPVVVMSDLSDEQVLRSLADYVEESTEVVDFDMHKEVKGVTVLNDYRVRASGKPGRAEVLFMDSPMGAISFSQVGGTFAATFAGITMTGLPTLQAAVDSVVTRHRM